MFVATKHAEIRLRQRGIPVALVEWLVFHFDSRFARGTSKYGRKNYRAGHSETSDYGIRYTEVFL
jgi:hypothetical protein